MVGAHAFQAEYGDRLSFEDDRGLRKFNRYVFAGGPISLKPPASLLSTRARD